MMAKDMKQFHYDIEKRITGLLSIDYDQGISKRIMVFNTYCSLGRYCSFYFKADMVRSFSKISRGDKIVLRGNADVSEGLCAGVVVPAAAFSFFRVGGVHLRVLREHISFHLFL